jgi:hypothetical protein
MGWTVPRSNPGGDETFRTCPDRPWAQPASYTMDTGSFPGVKSGRGVILTPHPFLSPWSWRGRAIPLLLLWAVGPAQSLSACTRVHLQFIQLWLQRAELHCYSGIYFFVSYGLRGFIAVFTTAGHISLERYKSSPHSPSIFCSTCSARLGYLIFLYLFTL